MFSILFWQKPPSVIGCQGYKKRSGAGCGIWMDLFLFRGHRVTIFCWNVTGPLGMSLKHGPMCSPLEGYKPLSLINKVRAWLAVGINEIHPLLIVPSQPKDLAEGKGHTAQSRQRNTMSLQIMPSLFYCRRLCPARGHFLSVCVHLSYCVSNNSDKDTKLFFPAALHEINRLMFALISCTTDSKSLHVRMLICSLISLILGIVHYSTFWIKKLKYFIKVISQNVKTCAFSQCYRML